MKYKYRDLYCVSSTIRDDARYKDGTLAPPPLKKTKKKTWRVDEVHQGAN